jgi:hypothetical protein
MPVRVRLWQTEFTRMPFLLRSIASARGKLTTAPFAAL